ncbi:MAG TPA: NTP transferase domain-containing protein, partial [Chthoniobacterales bacterium]|nr:NTP transferase domain-containing protein [Chthoniobacterales bacterium]
LTPNIFVSARCEVTWRPTDIKLVTDKGPSHGPLSGMAASLAAIETDCLLALAVDMPFITVPQLRGICHRAGAEVGAVPLINGKAEPLAAVYPKRAASIFADALKGTDHSLQEVVRRLAALKLVRKIPITDATARFFRSVNYPADLQPEVDCAESLPDTS